MSPTDAATCQGALITLSPPPTAMAWINHGTKHQLMAVPEIYLAPGDALIEVEFATVCGSDLHIVHGRRSAHVHLRAKTTIVPVAASMPREIAAPLSCASATAIAAIDAAASVMDLDGATILVTGASLVGFTVAAAATDRGARVIVSDPDPSRRTNALRFGAIETVDP